MSPEHVAHPYPTEQEKSQIMADTGIELKQLTNWFVNNRKRYWKPRVEARLQQQAQVAAVAAAATNISHVVTPGGDRPTFSVSQNVGTPYLALDMTQPTSLRQNQTPVTKNCPTIIPSDSVSSFASTSTTVRAVSDASMSGSDENASLTDSQGSIENEINDEIDDATGIITRTESVDVHILRPIFGARPSVEDVSILTNVPSSRIVKSFQNCIMVYTFPKIMLNEIQSRRDSEIVRIKKHFLKVFLTGNLNLLSFSHVSDIPQKRKRIVTEECFEQVVFLRPKYNRKNAPGTWRGACISATHFRDSSLPNLEEAARLFGYSQ